MVAQPNRLPVSATSAAPSPPSPSRRYYPIYAAESIHLAVRNVDGVPYIVLLQELEQTQGAHFSGQAKDINGVRKRKLSPALK